MAGDLVPDRGKGVLKNGANAGPGPPIGAKYLKSAMKRFARENPDMVNKAAELIWRTAAGETVDRFVTGDGQIVNVPPSIGDSLKAAALARDTVDTKPAPMPEIAPKTQVVVFEEVENYDTPWPDKVQKALETPILTPEEELES